MLRRKSWFELGADGLNHPDDFGPRLYGQANVALLGAFRV
jgi:hypothetical protein